MQETDRLETLAWSSSQLGIHFGLDCNLKFMSEKTGGFSLPDLQSVLRRSLKHGQKRLAASPEFGIVVTKEDFEMGLREVHSVMADSMGAPKIPNVKWEDVGKRTLTYSSTTFLNIDLTFFTFIHRGT